MVGWKTDDGLSICLDDMEGQVGSALGKAVSRSFLNLYKY